MKLGSFNVEILFILDSSITSKLSSHGAIRAIPYRFTVYTGGNWSTLRKPAMFGRVKQEELFSNSFPITKTKIWICLSAHSIKILEQPKHSTIYGVISRTDQSASSFGQTQYLHKILFLKIFTTRA